MAALQWWHACHGGGVRLGGMWLAACVPTLPPPPWRDWPLVKHRLVSQSFSPLVQSLSARKTASRAVLAWHSHIVNDPLKKIMIRFGKAIQSCFLLDAATFQTSIQPKASLIRFLLLDY